MGTDFRRAITYLSEKSINKVNTDVSYTFRLLLLRVQIALVNSANKMAPVLDQEMTFALGAEIALELLEIQNGVMRCAVTSP